MIKIHKLICTLFGVGCIKGGGTIAALVCCVCWFFAAKYGCDNKIFLTATLLITAIGIWSATKVEADWGKDSYRVVIDEVSGMAVGLLFVPVQLKYIATAFILFRFFDITKPLFIRKLEKLPGGWGVMADDLLAGIYTNLIMHVIVINNFF
jgi:phosphatidylglycerophosphatase A